MKIINKTLILFMLYSLNLVASEVSYETHALQNKDLPSLSEFLGDTFYRSRSQWSQRELNYPLLEQKENGLIIDDTKEIVTLHHTVTGARPETQSEHRPEDELEILTQIEALHIDQFEFSDVGYHFIIGQSGVVFEARPITYVGAHTRSLNHRNAGIAFLGCFDDQACLEEGLQPSEVSEAMVESAAKLIAYLSLKEGFAITRDTVIPRSIYENSKIGHARFPHSPGSRILARVEDILTRACEIAEQSAG